MQSLHQPRSLGTVAGAQHQGALIQHKTLPKCYVVGGVSGSGKRQEKRAKAVADKMHSGIPLQDEDRWPWLQVLADIISQHIIRDELAVVSCSALKQRYRDVLCGRDKGQEHAKDVAFVLLQPSKEVLAKRVQERAALGTHFMPASLLDSQLALMEVDPSAYRYDAQPPAAIVDDLMHLRQTEAK